MVESTDQKEPQQLNKDAAARSEPPPIKVDQPKIEQHSQTGDINSGRGDPHSLILLCCKDALRLYRLKSVLQVWLWLFGFSTFNAIVFLLVS